MTGHVGSRKGGVGGQRGHEGGQGTPCSSTTEGKLLSITMCVYVIICDKTRIGQ